MGPRPYVLKETNWKTVKDTDYKVAILPWGATEAHNYHLPYATDNYETEFVTELSSKIAWDKGIKTIILPTIPYGVNTQHLDIKLTINMNPTTQLAIISDVLESLEQQGIDRFVIINGHGGNNFRQMVRQLQKDTDIFISVIDWYKIGDMNDFFEIQGDHANEMETSFMQYAFPDLVLPLEDAGDGASKKLKINGFNDGIAWTPRQWTKVTKDTGIGDPKLSTPEKGKKHIGFVAGEISKFLIDFANADLDDMYE